MELAESKLHVRVTEKDILRGVRDSPYECPIALAIYRTLKKEKRYDVAVCEKTIRIDKVVVPLPRMVQKRVEAFDLGLGMKPFGFTLNLTKGG